MMFLLENYNVSLKIVKLMSKEQQNGTCFDSQYFVINVDTKLASLYENVTHGFVLSVIIVD